MAMGADGITENIERLESMAAGLPVERLFCPTFSFLHRGRS
jgi:hypothetical protein